MKRYLTLIAALLVCVLALSACGGNDDAEPTEETTTETTETTETVSEDVQPTPSPDDPEASTEEMQPDPLDALLSDMLGSAGIGDTIPLSADALANVYGIDGSTVVHAAAVNASAEGAFPQEIIMIQATDESAAKAIEKKLNARLAAIAEQAASYDPDSAAIANNSKAIINGSYVGMFFSPKYEDLMTQFENWDPEA